MAQAPEGRERHNPSKRIGLLTLPLHTNYGGIVQAVALSRYLADLGAEVVLLRRDHKPSLLGRLITSVADIIPHELVKGAERRTQSADYGWFVRKYVNSCISRIVAKVRHQQHKKVHYALVANALPLQTPPLYGGEDLARAVDSYGLDTVIVGSDQVWRVRYQPAGAISDYFLGFVKGPAIRKIAYAASFGTGEWEAPEHAAMVSKLLSRFDAVSARERSGVELCRSLFGRNQVEHTVDPTLLVDPAFYEQIAAPPEGMQVPALLQYVLDPSPDTKTFGLEVAESLNLPIRSLFLDEREEPIEIASWIRCFMDATYVVTNSFHGMVFAIIFRKNFLVLVNDERGADRFLSLLTKLGLEDRLIHRPSSALALRYAQEPIDYDAVGPKLEEWRQLSSDFLLRALGR